METSKTLLEKVLLLKPQDRFLLVDAIIRSIDEPNKELDEIWADEAIRRLIAYRQGKTKGIPAEQIFGENFDQ